MLLGACAVGAAFTVVLIGQPAGDRPALPFDEGTVAVAADDFVESVGVNTHLSYSSTAYDDFDSVKDALVDLGVRHIRDYPVPQNVEAINELSSEGISLTAIMGTPRPRPWMPFDLEELHEVVRDDIRGAVDAVEGANEWDNSDEEDWAPQLRDHQEALWDLMSEDERTNDIPVVAPSITWDYNMDEAGDLSEWVDLGNVHPYPGGRPPETRVASDIEANQSNNVGGVEVWATETGYHNAVSNGRGHPGVSEDVASTYLPQLFLHYFAIGVPRTFSYELVDQIEDPREREASFGLLRSDFTAKPSYMALQDLLRLLEDPGPVFQPGRLDYSLGGADDDTRHLLLQKRDGTFYLALWQSASIWDVRDAGPVEVDSRPVTIELVQPLSEARVSSLGDDDAVEVQRQPRVVAIDVGPDVQVVELVPEQTETTS